MNLSLSLCNNELIIHPLHRKGGVLFYLCPSFCSSRDIFRRIFFSNYWWQKSDIWSEASYMYPISWETFLDPSHSYFLLADLVGFYAHWTYMQGYHKWALAHSSSFLYSKRGIYILFNITAHINCTKEYILGILNALFCLLE